MRRPPSRIVTSCSPSMGASRCGRTRNSTFTSHWAGGIMRGSEAISSARKSPWSTRSSSRGSTRFISIVDSTRRRACESSPSTEALVGLLPSGPIELPFLFRLLPELLVVVPAQMDAPRFTDQLELGKDFFHFLRREGPLRFLPATLHPADLVRGHGCDDARRDICTCAVQGRVSRPPGAASTPAISPCGAASARPRWRRWPARRPLPPPIPGRTQDGAPAGGG